MGVVDMIGTLSFEAPGGGIACLNVTVPAPFPTFTPGLGLVLGFP